jgi:hypothetical protein
MLSEPLGETAGLSPKRNKFCQRAAQLARLHMNTYQP